MNQDGIICGKIDRSKAGKVKLSHLSIRDEGNSINFILNRYYVFGGVTLIDNSEGNVPLVKRSQILHIQANEVIDEENQRTTYDTKLIVLRKIAYGADDYREVPIVVHVDWNQSDVHEMTTAFYETQSVERVEVSLGMTLRFSEVNLFESMEDPHPITTVDFRSLKKTEIDKE